MQVEGQPAAVAPVRAGGVLPVGSRPVRSPSDVLRLLVALTVLLVAIIVALWADRTAAGVEGDVIEAIDRLPSQLVNFLVGSVQIVATLVPLSILLSLLIMRRWRLMGLVIVGAFITVYAVRGIFFALDRSQPAGLGELLQRPSWVTGAAFPDPSFIGSAVAVITVWRPWLTRRGTHWAWLVVLLAVAARLASGTGVLLDLVLAGAAGAAIGSGVLLAFRVPDRRPDAARVAAALGSIGMRTEVVPAGVPTTGSSGWRAVLPNGERLFVKAYSGDERSADLLYRLYRYLRFRGVGDDRPFSSLRRTVEHEALVSLQLRESGVPTPHLRAIAPVGPEAVLLAFDEIDGVPLSWVGPGALTDVVLDRIWDAVAAMRSARIAHRDLSLDNIMLTRRGAVHLIDVGFGEVAADDDVLAIDVAEVLAATAGAVGVERAVGAAIEAIGADAVRPAAARLQPHAVSESSRRALKAQPGGFPALRAEIARACGGGEIRLVDLRRLPPRVLMAWVGVAAAVYVLLPQIAGLGDVWTQVRDASWAWFVPALALSAITYVGAALSVAGAVPGRVPPLAALATQVATSYVNNLAPAGVGGMALNVRFYQRAGVDPAVAVAAVGVGTVVGFLVHFALLGLFLVWAGRGLEASDALPSGRVVLLGLLGLAVVLGVIFLIAPLRRRLVPRALASLRRAVGGLREVATRPGKLGLLVGGRAMLTLGYLLCLVVCVQAFGGELPVAATGVAYLTAAAVGAAAPTPGGLGAVEAALLAGLVAVGGQRETALPAVFMFRLVTFWLPILPGWIAFTRLQRAERV